MKRSVLTITILLTCLQSFAQFKRHDIEFFGGVGNYIGGNGEKANTTDLVRKRSLMYSAGAAFVVKKGFSIGLTLSQNTFEEQYYNTLAFVTENYYYDAISLALEFKTDYLNKKFIHIYGAWGLGLSHFKGLTRFSTGASIPENTNGITYCAMPLGIRVGNKYGLYVEGGIGYKGIVTGGFSYKMGK